eukprot:3800682-Pyramimonas_sp.AAC.3
MYHRMADRFFSRTCSCADGAVIGSASLRRQAQILQINPTLKCVNFRGNVQSRIRKLQEDVVDATLLAYAGLRRLDMTEHISEVGFKSRLPPCHHSHSSRFASEESRQLTRLGKRWGFSCPPCLPD